MESAIALAHLEGKLDTNMARLEGKLDTLLQIVNLNQENAKEDRERQQKATDDHEERLKDISTWRDNINGRIVAVSGMIAITVAFVGYLLHG